MLRKIGSLDNDNNTKFLIKESYQRNYQNEEMKSRDIYNNKLDKLKKTYEYETQRKNDHFLKIEVEATTVDEEKLQSEIKDHPLQQTIQQQAMKANNL